MVVQILCIFCNRLDIENEFHFLLECPLYNKRIPLIEACKMEIEHFDNVVREDKFIAIMKNKQVTVIVALAKYVYNGMFVHSQSDPAIPKHSNMGMGGESEQGLEWR